MMLSNYEIIKSREFRDLEKIPKHYVSNVMLHSLRVAYIMWKMASKSGLDRKSAIRVGLLHDMCYTLPHERASRKGWYVFYHPVDAAQNAERYFGINKKERNAILYHMFPVSPSIPTNSIGWCLFFADKIATVWDYAAGSKTNENRRSDYGTDAS